MNTVILFNYLNNMAIAALEERLVLDILDGYSIHVGPDLVKLAEEQNITIMKLPKHQDDFQ